MSIIRPQTYEVVTEGVIKQYLYICFWLSWSIPLGIWKAVELINKYFN